MDTSFATRLREARELRELSQAALAYRADIPAATISRLEAGARLPSIMTLHWLADALDVSADYLLGRASEPGREPARDVLWLSISRLTTRERQLLQGFVNAAERTRGRHT